MMAILDKPESVAVHGILQDISTHYPQVGTMCKYYIIAW